MTLHEVIKTRTNIKKELKLLREKFEKEEKQLNKKINNLNKLYYLGTSIDSVDIEKVQLAESLIEFQGDPTGKNIHLRAISKIANDPNWLKSNYLGNKRYDSYYQECNCKIGMGPSHGTICDRIELLRDVRTRNLTDEEKDACIYYLSNIEKIQEIIDTKTI